MPRSAIASNPNSGLARCEFTASPRGQNDDPCDRRMIRIHATSVYILEDSIVCNSMVLKILVRSTPHPVTVTTRIITFLVGNPYKPSFATVTG